MLERLKKKIKKKGIACVASEMKYKSETTLRKWIRTNRIPPIAHEKVKNYLSTKKVA